MDRILFSDPLPNETFRRLSLGASPLVIPRCADWVGGVAIGASKNVEGRGLFASKNIEAGELVMVSNPLEVNSPLPLTPSLILSLSVCRRPHLSLRSRAVGPSLKAVLTWKQWR